MHTSTHMYTPTHMYAHAHMYTHAHTRTHLHTRGFSVWEMVLISLTFSQRSYLLPFHHFYQSPLELFGNPCPFLVLQLGLVKSPVLSRAILPPVPDASGVASTTPQRRAPERGAGWPPEGRRAPGRGHLSRTRQAVRGIGFRKDTGHRAVKIWGEACGELTTQGHSTGSRCWLLKGTIRMGEEMTVPYKQNRTRLGRLRK